MYPEGVRYDVTFVEETTVTSADVAGSMGSSMTYLRDWIDRQVDADFDPYRSAHRAVFGEDPQP